jgi:rhomboid family protein
VFPLRDDNPTLGTSVATLAIIGLNLASWFVLQGFGSDPALARSVCEYGAIPGDLLGTVPQGTLVPLAQGLSCRIEGAPNWIAVFTSMFMHGSWFHILSNLWFLWVFGDNVEDAMGPLRFAVFYLLCGLAAVLTQVFASPDSTAPIVGASGAIGGVMGAYAVLYPRAPVHMLIFLGFYLDRIVVPAYLMLGYWFVVQLLSGLPSLGGGAGTGAGVAFWAHVGGFLVGLLMVFAFRDPRRLAAHRARVRWAGGPRRP